MWCLVTKTCHVDEGASTQIIGFLEAVACELGLEGQRIKSWQKRGSLGLVQRAGL